MAGFRSEEAEQTMAGLGGRPRLRLLDFRALYLLHVGLPRICRQAVRRSADSSAAMYLLPGVKLLPCLRSSSRCPPSRAPISTSTPANALAMSDRRQPDEIAGDILEIIARNIMAYAGRRGVADRDAGYDAD